MNLLLKSALLVIMLGSLAGCHIGKKLTSFDKVVTEDEKLIEAVFNAQEQAKYLEIRFTGKSEIDEEKMSFMGSIKLVRDSVIWISLRSSMGIEIARVLAKPDSVWIVSKVLKMKQKGDWKLLRDWTGFGLDFTALQGILTQRLFTAGGSEWSVVHNDMAVIRKEDAVWIGWKPEMESNALKSRYLAQFRIESNSKTISDVQIRDGNGRWVTKVHFQYSKENVNKKIEFNGIDESTDFNAEINIVAREVRSELVINFDLF